MHVWLWHRYKPPVGDCLELPATLLQAGESAEEAALRCVKEETGYVGTARRLTCPCGSSCGMTDERLRICVRRRLHES